jgi:hypothetical protein
VFCKNRDRLLDGDIAGKFFASVLNLPQVRKANGGVRRAPKSTAVATGTLRVSQSGPRMHLLLKPEQVHHA